MWPSTSKQNRSPRQSNDEVRLQRRALSLLQVLADTYGDVHGYLWVSELCKKPLRGKLSKAEFSTALGNPHTPRIPTFRTAPATTA